MHTSEHTHTHTPFISQRAITSYEALWLGSAVLTALTLDLLKCIVVANTHTHAHCGSLWHATTINLTAQSHSFDLLKQRKSGGRVPGLLSVIVPPHPTLTSDLSRSWSRVHEREKGRREEAMSGINRYVLTVTPASGE